MNHSLFPPSFKNHSFTDSSSKRGSLPDALSGSGKFLFFIQFLSVSRLTPICLQISLREIILSELVKVISFEIKGYNYFMKRRFDENWQHTLTSFSKVLIGPCNHTDAFSII